MSLFSRSLKSIVHLHYVVKYHSKWFPLFSLNLVQCCHWHFQKENQKPSIAHHVLKGVTQSSKIVIPKNMPEKEN